MVCFDEIAPHKGQGQYELVIYAPELGIVLDVLKDRKKATLEEWFVARGPDWCAAVEVYCADMWDQYHQAAQAHLPNAQPVVDRFHVMKNLNDAVTKARRAIQRQATDEQQETLKGCRWLLVKNRENLTEEEQPDLSSHADCLARVERLVRVEGVISRLVQHVCRSPAGRATS